MLVIVTCWHSILSNSVACIHDLFHINSQVSVPWTACRQLLGVHLSHDPASMTQALFVHKSKKVLDKSNMHIRYFATRLQLLEALGLYRTPFPSVMASRKYLQQQLCTLIEYCKSQTFGTVKQSCRVDCAGRGRQNRVVEWSQRKRSVKQSCRVAEKRDNITEKVHSNSSSMLIV